MTPKPSYDQILNALAQFDTEERGTPVGEKWRYDGKHHYAIEYEGKLYPIERIISMASGVPVGDFNQGEWLREHLEDIGVNVVELGQDVAEGVGEAFGPEDYPD